MIKNSIFHLFIATLISLNYFNALKLASKNENFKIDRSKIFHRQIAMNNMVHRREEYRCKAIELSEPVQFITGLQILGNMKLDHHMTVTSCENIDPAGRHGDSFDCNNSCYPGEKRRLFTWALDADGIKFEKGVGFKVSGNTRLNYLVLQVHYNGDIPVGYIDTESAYLLTMTYQHLPYQVGVYTLGDNGLIPPKQEKYHMDAACEVKFNYDIVPINYRTHAHNISSVISGYVIKNGDYIELGRMSPKQPEEFYPVTIKNLIVTKGDYLVSRCTYNSMKRDYITPIGPTHTDEMCVFYLLFYTDYQGRLENEYCFFENEFTLEDSLPFPAYKIPRNSDSLEGVHLKDPKYELFK